MNLNRNQWLELLLIGAILLTPLIILIPTLNNIPFPTYSQYSDLVISHLPNIIEIRNSLTNYHQIPFWSETILGGYPIVSDPLSSIWYPPLWLTWVLPIPFSINLLIILHLFFSELGMYLFLWRKGTGSIPALIGALMIGLAPKIWGHYAFGHITLIFAVSWTPWLLYFMVEKKLSRRLFRFFPGLILGWIILADIRWFVYSAFIFIFYGLYLSFFEDTPASPLLRIWDCVKNIFANIMTAFVICLPYLLLVFQYSNLSTRNLMNFSDQLALSLPPEGLFGMFFPDMAGNAEWITYTGALTLIILIHFFFSKKDSEGYFWVIVFCGSLYFAMGPVFLFDFLSKIPGMNLLRVPSRSIIVSIFAISILTAKGCDLIIRESKEIRIGNTFWFNLITFGIGIFSTLFVIGMSFFVKSILIKFIWGAVFYLIYFVLLNMRDRQIFSGKVWGILLLPIFVLDLLTVGNSQIRYENYASVLNQQNNVVNAIIHDGQDGRIYSPSYSIPQQTASNNQLKLVEGINPLQLASYADYMASATGIPYASYGVSIPPFKTGNPEEDNRYSQPDLELLGKLNVRYVVSEYDIINSGLKQLQTIGRTHVYENLKYSSMATLIGTGSQTEITIKNDRPGWVELSASGPGLLQISEQYYPGWTVFVDGVKKDIIIHDQIFQSVNLESGLHRVIFKFTPDLVMYGFMASILIIIGYMGVKFAHS